jgi:hypothetical protein
MGTATLVGNAPIFVAITIPNNSGTGSLLSELVANALGAGMPSGVQQIQVHSKQPGSTSATDRVAFMAATNRPGAAIVAGDFTSHGYPVAAGEAYAVPSEKLGSTYVRSMDASTVSALAIVLF